MSETADILRKAKALIDTPEKWEHESPSGRVRNVHGVCLSMCSYCAISEAAKGTGKAFDIAAEFCRANGIEGSVGNWNDAPGRTHPEVMEAFDKAISLAEQGGAG